jgi:cobalt-zinc-cadmium efflux system membrane fusion protein
MTTTLCWIQNSAHASTTATAAEEQAGDHGDAGRDEHGDASRAEHGDEGEAHGEEEGLIALTPQQVEHAGLTLAQVGPANIRETLPLYGRIVPDAEREHAVAARFPGLIQKVTKQVGDPVQQGETLAVVESNESLKSYYIKASLSGVVTQRDANVGEQTGDRTLFLIGDYSAVWVELAVFPGELANVRVGQKVQVENRNTSVSGEGRIIAVSPVGSHTSQATTVRVLLDNAQRQWVPGLFVNAEVVLAEQAVPLSVSEAAVQIVEDRNVVFVATGDGFEVRPVVLGRADGAIREVLQGLAAGEPYVARNSFILKSELGKEGVDHGH